MSQLTYKEHKIDQRDDNYVNLTQMAKANNKRLNAYIQSLETQRYLKAAQESICHESCQMAEILQTLGFGKNKATWGHPLVALHFGQWVSPEFHVWCNQNIHTLMTTGTTSINGSQDDRIESLCSEVSRLTELVSSLVATPALPAASVDPAPQPIAAQTERAMCNRLVRSFAHNQSTSRPLTERDIWQWMYRELKYRYNYDAYARVKKTSNRKLYQVEIDGQMPNLLAVCHHFLSPHLHLVKN